MPKHKELNLTRKFQINQSIHAPRAKDYLEETTPPVFNEEKYEARCDYRYSTNFKMYTQLIENCLKKAKRPMNIRQIHEALGVFVQPRWTMDAIEMSNNIITFLGYVNHYSWFDGKKTEERVRCWNGHISPPDPKTFPIAAIRGAR